MTMTGRVITPEMEERMKSYPLYSQDNKGREAVCIAVFAIGNVRWFVLEGQKCGGDTILFAIVCGLYETEYGYVSVNELESLKVDGMKYGLKGCFQVEPWKDFKPTVLDDINDNDLHEFLDRMYSQ